MVLRLGVRTTFHKLWHYSATELIRAGDIQTVAGRLGHAEGGIVLAFYVKVRELHQTGEKALVAWSGTAHPELVSGVVQLRPEV